MTPPPTLPASVLRTLAAVRRRRRALALAQAASWVALGLAALLAATVLGRWLPEEGLAPAATILKLLAFGVVLGPLAVLVVPAWRRTGDLLGLARAIDDRVPETRDSLFVAVDLTRPGADASVHGPGGEALRQLHLEQAADRAASVRPAELLPLGDLGGRALLGPAALALIAALALFGPDSLRTGWSRLASPDAASDPAASEADAEVVDLTLTNLRLELTPPAYSGHEPLVLEGTTGDFQALAGTRVRFEAGLARARGEARIRWSADLHWPAEVGGDRVRGEFTVPGGGGWRLELDRLAGTSRTRRFVVELLPDRPPELQITAPAVDELQPDTPLPLSASTRDDFGLSRLDLVVLKRGREVARQRIADVTGQAAWDGQHSFVPRQLLGEVGGDLELVVESWDNDTVQGPKVTRSRSVEVYVPTPRDQHRKVLALKGQLLDRSVDLLADVLVDDAATHLRSNTREILVQHDRHAAGMAGVLELGQRLGEAMQGDRFEQRSTFLGIGQLLENLARTWRPLEDLVAESMRGGRHRLIDAGTARVLRLRRTDLVDELERVILDLEAFMSLHQGRDALDSLHGVEPEMAELADLVRQAQDGKPVSAELDAAMQSLRQRLAELAAALQTRSGGPDEGFVNEVPPEMGEDKLAEIEKALAEGRHEDALALIQEAMDALSKMQDSLAGEQERQAGAQVAAELQQQLQEGIDRVAELEAAQQAVIDGTEQLQERFGSGDGLEPDAVAELDAAITALRQELGQITPDTLMGGDGGAVRSWERMALRQGIRLQEAWDEGALAEAAEYAEMTGADLQEIARVLRGARGGQRSDNLDAAERAEAAQALAESVAQRLQEGARQAAQARQRASAASEGLQGQQQGVSDGVAQLQQDMGEMGGSAFNPAGGREQLDGAQQLMQNAGSRLRQGRAGQALGAEQDALRQLQSYRESLEGAKQAMQSGESMGQGPPRQPGGGFDTAGQFAGTPEGGEVEMSDPDDFVTPEALRRLLQEGAADDAPERYRPMNRGYYEELAR